MSSELLELSQKPRAMRVATLPCDHREGDQALWCVWGDYIITSTSNVLGAWETYVFHADMSGKITDWLELAGSFKGPPDHGKAIRGYIESLDQDD